MSEPAYAEQRIAVGQAVFDGLESWWLLQPGGWRPDLDDSSGSDSMDAAFFRP